MPDQAALAEIVMNISTRFVNLRSDEVDEGIGNALQAIGESTGMEYGYLYLFSDDRTRLTRTHGWCSLGLKMQQEPVDDLDVGTIPWTAVKINKGEVIHIPWTAEFPTMTSAEKNTLQARGCQSFLLIPLMNRRASIGFLGFESLQAGITWPEETIALLRMVGEIFIHTLERQKLERELLSSEEKYRNLVENINEVIFSLDVLGHFTYISPVIEQVAFYKAEGLIGRPMAFFIHPEDLPWFLMHLQKTLSGQSEPQEYRILNKEGSIRHVRISACRLLEGGKPVGLTGIMSDLTERMWAEGQIRYLSFLDTLTGLYNRVYFEEELKRLDTERQLPISVIMGDVNGLKLINDAFGHQEGDKLLIRVAAILKECCRKEDVIARVGGDEFAIFLPGTSYEVTLGIVDRIRRTCSQARQDAVELSISLGAVTKEEPSQDLQKILKEAEERMYHSKLLESKNVRDSIISSLQKTLFEKGPELEEHTQRVRELALQIGPGLGLPDNELEELALLATFHDIGKIAIPEGIVIKWGDLSLEELSIMRRHPEIGYRIAGSSRELAPIAEAILAHHEWWDGNGYPRGLQGQEIPLISRIIAVVDAYDVMIHGSLYKEPVSREEALRELKENAGSQFDPNLVGLFIEIISAG